MTKLRGTTASDRGRASKARGKADERDVARILGGKRHPADSGGDEDIEHSIISVQVKGGVRIVNGTIRAGLDAATAGAAPGKLPVLVLVDRAGTRIRRFAVMDLGVFADWLGVKSDE